MFYEFAWYIVFWSLIWQIFNSVQCKWSTTSFMYFPTKHKSSTHFFFRQNGFNVEVILQQRKDVYFLKYYNLYWSEVYSCRSWVYLVKYFNKLIPKTCQIYKTMLYVYSFVILLVLNLILMYTRGVISGKLEPRVRHSGRVVHKLTLKATTFKLFGRNDEFV